MYFRVLSLSAAALCASGSLLWGALTPEQVAALPAPASHRIDFTKEIKPILEKSCGQCHGRGKSNGGFRIDDRELFSKSGDNGASVRVGKSAESYLIELVAAVDPDNVMPQKGTKLTPEQVGLLRAWIDQGMLWDKDVYLGKTEPINFKPRRLDLPPAERSDENPIDRLLRPYLKSNKVKNGKVVDDRTYARRVYLDVIGLLPSPEELQAFLDDRSVDKREQLVHRLLNDDLRYAEHWLTFWNDALRNDYRGTGFIDGGRKQITTWLYEALATNKAYDKFVAELINPQESAEGFTKGIVWRGVVNASQTPQMQAAQNISQVFMGVNLKCASCHDSFINDWTLADAYGLASVYADEPLELVRCDNPTGKKADVQFIYPELGKIESKAEKKDRLKRLAEVVTKQQNGRLTRTLVNRLWARFLGHGIVEPVDEMDNPAWNTDLLDWLATDFADNGYDVKHTMALILTSHAYQMPAVDAGELADKQYIFRGPSVRRLSAEQFRDAIAALTGKWYSLPSGDVNFWAHLPKAEQRKLTEAELKSDAKWIWSSPGALDFAEAETVYFRRIINLPEKPDEALVMAMADNKFTLYINGNRVGSGENFKAATLMNAASHFVKGENLIAISAENSSSDNKKDDKPNNPAGLYLYARVRVLEDAKTGKAARTMDFGTDNEWIATAAKFESWEKRDLPLYGWIQTSALAPWDAQPWDAGEGLTMAMSRALRFKEVRSALVPADPLMVALGRPNREQVITSRPYAATTLQALELTNGDTLAKLLQEGAKSLVESGAVSEQDFLHHIFWQALGRKGSSSELKMARAVIGKQPTAEGVEDLLWAMTMQPEFQLIY